MPGSSLIDLIVDGGLGGFGGGAWKPKTSKSLVTKLGNILLLCMHFHRSQVLLASVPPADLLVCLSSGWNMTGICNRNEPRASMQDNTDSGSSCSISVCCLRLDATWQRLGLWPQIPQKWQEPQPVLQPLPPHRSVVPLNGRIFRRSKFFEKSDTTWHSSWKVAGASGACNVACKNSSYSITRLSTYHFQKMEMWCTTLHILIAADQC